MVSRRAARIPDLGRARLGWAVALWAALNLPVPAAACSSCGCTLSSDWASQGYTTGAGLHIDLRYDSFDQDRLRTGTGVVQVGGIGYPTDREIQRLTRNRNLEMAIDYSPDADWGVVLQVPYFDRSHTTIAAGDMDVSSSHSESAGDVRLIGRYQGFTPERTTGVELGSMLPTGGIHYDFRGGPQAGQPLDRGLQPGTGTAQLLAGAYHFGSFRPGWDYFAHALVQVPLTEREDFRPGAGLNVNLGIRHGVGRRIAPQVQVNARIEGREAGPAADRTNSGATLIHLSPGVNVSLARGIDAYGFVQVPVVQRVNGYQLDPRYSASVGIRWSIGS